MRECVRRTASLIGPLWAIGISAYILFAPMIRVSSVSSSLERGGAASQEEPAHSESSWFRTYGLSALKPLLIAIILSLLPLLGRSVKSRRILGAVSTASLAAFCGLAIFSVGSFYLPSVLALFTALMLELYGNRAAAQS